MKRLVEYQLEEGGSIWVEVEEPEPEGGITRVGREDLPSKAAQGFEEALDTVKPAATAIINKLRGLSEPPDEVVAEFGLKMNAKAGAVIASAGAEANYKVTLKWIRK